MIKTYLSYNNIVCSLGFDSETVFSEIKNGKSGIQEYQDNSLLNSPFCVSLLSKEILEVEFKKISSIKDYTKLEKMMICSLSKVITDSALKLDAKVGLIISTTKGNIDVLEKDSIFQKKRAYLATLGMKIKEFFHFENDAIVISNACVSGLLSVSVAKRYIKSGLYDHVFIVSGDIVSRFVLTGFHSFQALSKSACKPYSNDRDGITIGEAAASALVTKERGLLCDGALEILGDATCNDANHISGPSRTGEGLYRAITSALQESKIPDSEIDYISAHGTATLFNDEMEAVAFNRLGLQNIPLNSLKGFVGHTTGAAGLLETIIAMHSLQNNLLIASKGFSEIGVSKALNVIEANQNKNLNTFLKTSSGFGGCNTAAIFRKL
ncbi:3-oxoacyl-[acyl-carrier-protein] synthase-1 [Flavobacteriaceae bacterium MAR_2010_188]|nr:3-oxoacyl-[acyl-carrier-protein] synthase-1 [Flavobacteriaceae bacterium MAR_2010_188]